MGKTKKIIGVIGGTGKTGKQFKRFFEKNGFKVLIASRHTKLTPIELAKKSDVVIVSVPISSTVKVIKQIGRHIKKGSLLMDLTSLKKEPVKAMLKHSKCEVIGTHPMFGPGIKSFKNQTIVLCPARTKKWLPWLIKLLKNNKAIIKISTPEKHDKIMSAIQGMMHFSSIAFCRTLKEANINIKEALSFTSPVFKLSLDMTGRILNQDPKLYSDIELLNPEVKKLIKLYISSVSELQKIINEKNEKEFIKYFDSAASHLGSFKKEAEQESDYLINKMAENRRKQNKRK